MRRWGEPRRSSCCCSVSDRNLHPELKNAPVLFWGWSAAASFSTTFAERYPERTVAFIRYHTRLRGLPVDMRVLKDIPALLIAGGKDETAATEDAETLWKGGRAAAAPWTFAIEPDAPHSSEEIFVSPHDMIVPWIAAVVSQRVATDGGRLRRVAGKSGCLGSNRTGEVASQATFPGPDVESSCCPMRPRRADGGL